MADPNREALSEPLKLPMLPRTLLNTIGEYGMARTDRVSELTVQYRWEMLISGIKEYAVALLESERQAHAAEVEGLRADARGALVIALSCIRWQSFGECRTPDHGGAPPAPDVAAKAIEAAIATLGGRGQ